RASVRLLHTRPDRRRLGSRRRQPASEHRRDPARDGRQPLPLRHVHEDRGGHFDVARLIRTEKEVEGRYEEVWLVVEEDALDQWPDGPRDTVGRPAPRQDGHQRATGTARYTADIALPGMLHAAVLRSPHARARVTRLDLSKAGKAPGVRAVLEPGDTADLVTDCNFQGQPIAAIAADTFAQARAALGLIDVEFELLEPLLDPELAVEQKQLTTEPRTNTRGDVERGLAEADAVVEATYRTQ